MTDQDKKLIKYFLGFMGVLFCISLTVHAIRFIFAKSPEQIASEKCAKANATVNASPLGYQTSKPRVRVTINGQSYWCN
ncbi:MAG: hypothetical protein SWZ49_18705 [Cyanobacteriota bacterium]|nr:hypothetical protein [Cyanobacteriota bacterium]